MEIMESVKALAATFGYLITIITFTTIIVKPVRNAFRAYVRNRARDEEQDNVITSIDAKSEQIMAQMQILIEQSDNNKQANQAVLRDRITQAYYQHKSDGFIPEYERKNLVELYNVYKLSGGNSYCEYIYKEMLNLPTSPITEREVEFYAN